MSTPPRPRPSEPVPLDPEGFDPSAIATPANFLTVIRLLAAPLLFAMIVDQPTGWVVWTVWTVLSLTDLVDGWVARRWGTTRSGAFLDPLADKVLVLGALFSLVVVDRFPVWPVAIIAIRELSISLYRVYWSRRSLSIPARPSAKAKTLVQSFAVGAVLMPPLTDVTWLADGLLYLAVVLAVVSGVQYVLDGSRAASTTGHRPH